MDDIKYLRRRLSQVRAAIERIEDSGQEVSGESGTIKRHTVRADLAQLYKKEKELLRSIQLLSGSSYSRLTTKY